ERPLHRRLMRLTRQPPRSRPRSVWSTHKSLACGLHPVVSLLLQLESKLLADLLHAPSVRKYVHKIRLDVIMPPLIVSDKDNRILAGTKLVHALGDDPQRVDVEARIRFVKDREPRFEYRHLQDLPAFFLAARKTFVDRPLEELRIHLHNLRLLFQIVIELKRI